MKINTVEARWADTLVSGQVCLRPPWQDPIWTLVHTNSVFTHSCEQPAPVSAPPGCPLMGASTVLKVCFNSGKPRPIISAIASCPLEPHWLPPLHNGQAFSYRPYTNLDACVYWNISNKGFLSTMASWFCPQSGHFGEVYLHHYYLWMGCYFNHHIIIFSINRPHVPYMWPLLSCPDWSLKQSSSDTQEPVNCTTRSLGFHWQLMDKHLIS